MKDAGSNMDTEKVRENAGESMPENPLKGIAASGTGDVEPGAGDVEPGAGDVGPGTGDVGPGTGAVPAGGWGGRRQGAGRPARTEGGKVYTFRASGKLAAWLGFRKKCSCSDS